MNWVRDHFRQFDQKIVAENESGTVTYAEFVQKIEYWHMTLKEWGIQPGDRVGLISDYHIEVAALLQALLDTACIVVPLSKEDHSLFAERLEIACTTKIITVDNDRDINANTVVCRDVDRTNEEIHPLLQSLISERKAGFVIYTSGSTGKGKAVLLEYGRMVQKYKDKTGKSFRTLLFLKLDHIGGLNTLFSVIFNGGTIVTSPSRQAKDICQTIATYAVELLPTTPSFLTMLLVSHMYQSYDLSSLKIISYGTEVMPHSTLTGIHHVFPEVTLKQTYGLSELGILSTKSKDSESEWMKVGGKDFTIKIKENVLWIKSNQAMLGYLNAPSPFDDDGWYNTGDKVEVDGEYIRILGRESEIINVAGEKVFPIEVESFLMTLDNVQDVVVRGKRSPITGNILWAEFVLTHDEEIVAFKKRITEQCQQYLPPFKVPRLITITSHDKVLGSRFKKIRTK